MFRTLFRARLSRVFCCLAILPVFCGGLAYAAPPQDLSPQPGLRGVIVLARHGVRAPIESETRSGAYNAQPWPAWPAAPGVLTAHGAQALRLLGEYYRVRYSSLLNNSDCAHPRIYAEANTTQRTIASAGALLSGLVPGCRIAVHHRPHQPNPLFSPAQGAMLDQQDRQELTDATLGRMGDQPAWFANAFARPLELMHQVLVDCSGGSGPACDRSKPDFRTTMVKNGAARPRDPRVENPVSLGADFAENFLLEYSQGFPMGQVGWGRVSRARLNDLMEMNTRYHDFMLRTPYYAQVAASDLAAHIRDTIVSLAAGDSPPGRLGATDDRFILLDGHDSNLTWLGGLLRLDWLLPDQTFNATPPGSALVFEVYGSGAAASVRVLFISQTLDQIRALRPLTGAEKPSVAPIFIPGCSRRAPDYGCSVEDFAHVVSSAIDPRWVEQTVK